MFPSRRPGRRLFPATDDAGLSLAELLVSMVITSIVFILGATMLTTTLRERRFADARTAQQADARIMTEMLSRDLRVAVPAPNGTSQSAFAFASPRKIVFYSRDGGATPVFSQITYEVDSTSQCLRRTVIPYTGGAFPASASTTRCVAPGPVNIAGEVLFSFHRLRVDMDTAPVALSVPTSGATLPGDEATLRMVASVQVTLRVRAQDKLEVAPAAVSESITLVNQSNAIRIGKIS
ncbi:MAG: hypothetical protein IPJ14_20875 [Kineosporiaceae bacterium]|nr:hypothetical protein [Kineosporiaceae bacterium]MBK8076576.1 hypothetical protein [Kineosporiaceae bacterium]